MGSIPEQLREKGSVLYASLLNGKVLGFFVVIISLRSIWWITSCFHIHITATYTVSSQIMIALIVFHHFFYSNVILGHILLLS